jgi:hypothetical protein
LDSTAHSDRLKYRNALLDKLAPMKVIGLVLLRENQPKQPGTDYSMQSFCAAIKSVDSQRSLASPMHLDLQAHARA